MQTISLDKIKYQSLEVKLWGQQTTITLSQKDVGLFLSLSVGDKVIVSNILCLNNNLMIRYKYLGFTGDLFFDDTQGSDNPDYTGLGDRFLLYYDGDL